MPLMRYFAWVGSVLLALLFIADASLPKISAGGNTELQLPVIRIYSDEKKWPARIDYDTAAMLPKASANTEVITPATVSPTARGALAALQRSDVGPPIDTKKPEARTQRLHRFAKMHRARPVLLVARRPPFGWFGPTTW